MKNSNRVLLVEKYFENCGEKRHNMLRKETISIWVEFLLINLNTTKNVITNNAINNTILVDFWD